MFGLFVGSVTSTLLIRRVSEFLLMPSFKLLHNKDTKVLKHCTISLIKHLIMRKKQFARWKTREEECWSHPHFELIFRSWNETILWFSVWVWNLKAYSLWFLKFLFLQPCSIFLRKAPLNKLLTLFITRLFFFLYGFILRILVLCARLRLQWNQSTCADVHNSAFLF